MVVDDRSYQSTKRSSQSSRLVHPSYSVDYSVGDYSIIQWSTQSPCFGVGYLSFHSIYQCTVVAPRSSPCPQVSLLLLSSHFNPIFASLSLYFIQREFRREPWRPSRSSRFSFYHPTSYLVVWGRETSSLQEKDIAEGESDQREDRLFPLGGLRSERSERSNPPYSPPLFGFGEVLALAKLLVLIRPANLPQFDHPRDRRARRAWRCLGWAFWGR